MAESASGEDAALVRSFLAKRRDGKPPSRAEQRAYDRFQTAETERRGLEFVRAVPKRIVIAETGRQTKLLHDAHRQHGIPLYGKTIDLFDALRACLDRLAEFGKRNLSDDPLLQGNDSPGLERYRNAAADVKEIERDRLRQELLPRDTAHAILSRWSMQLMRLGEAFAKRGWTEQHEMLNETLTFCEKILQELITDDEDETAAATED